MYGVSASNSRSSRSSTSTSSAARASRPAESSDGRSGTGSSGRAEGIREDRRLGHPRLPVVAAATRRFPGSPSCVAALELAPRQLGHEVERVDLPVRMRDRRADLGAAILEDEHVVDVGRAPSAALRSAQRSITLRAPVGPERPERRVVLGCVEHDLAALVRASPASGSRTSARRTARAPRARRGRTGRSPTAGSAASAASRRRT
jgi:hypothetical protein